MLMGRSSYVRSLLASKFSTLLWWLGSKTYRRSIDTWKASCIPDNFEVRTIRYVTSPICSKILNGPTYLSLNFALFLSCRTIQLMVKTFRNTFSPFSNYKSFLRELAYDFCQSWKILILSLILLIAFTDFSTNSSTNIFFTSTSSQWMGVLHLRL